MVHFPIQKRERGIVLLETLVSHRNGKSQKCCIYLHVYLSVLCRRFILTATDLFMKSVVARPLHNKTAAEVTRKIVSILMDFGLVDRIITDQGRKFVNEVNI